MIISHAPAPYQMHVAQQQAPAATAAMFPTASRPSMAFAAPLSVPQNLNAVTVIPPPTPVSLQLATTTPPTTMYVGSTQQQQQHMHQPVPVHNPYAIGSPPQINLYPQQSFVVPSLPHFTAHVTAQPQQPQQHQQLVHAHHFTTPQALAIDLNPLPTSPVVIYDDSKMQRTLCEGRYIPDCIIGKGTYGEVLRCFDTRSHTHVAVKITHRDMAYRKSAMTEVNTLSRLSQCSSIVRLLDVFEDDNRVCIVSELLFKNLYDIQRSRNFEAMHVSDVRHVSFAVISALTALHQNGGIHCDVKPENVMLRSNDFRSTCLIDFGAVRQFFENQYYDVQSLWYRAPEVLMGVPYNHMIDSWGVGCLLYELQTGSPLLPGENVDDQLERIVALCGAPGIEHASQPGSPHTTKLSVMFGAHRQPSHETLRQAFRNMIKPTTYHFEDDAMLFADLVARLLHPDPNRRLSCFDALCHPFFSRMDAPVSVPLSSELQHPPASSTRRRTSHIACAPTHHLVGRPIVANTNDEVLGGSCTNLPANITYTAGANIFATSPQVNSVPSFLANVQGTTAITTPRHHHVQHATYVLPSFPTVQAGQRVAWCSPPDVSMSIPQHTSHPSSSTRRQHPQSSEVNWVDTRAHVHVNWCIS